MNQPTIHIRDDTFRSRLIPAAAVLYTLSAILGLPGCVYLLSSNYRSVLRYELFLRGYVEAQVINSWMWIHGALAVISCICAAVTAAGLWIVLSERKVKGLSILGTWSHWFLIFVRVTGILAVISYAVQMAASIAAYVTTAQGLVMIVPMLMFEGLMGFQALYLHRKLRAFLSSAGDCTTSIAYTLSSGKLDNTSFPPFAATGFLILSIFCFFIAIDRTFFLTIVDAFPQDYFQLMVVRHPAQLMSGASYLIGGIANLLMYLYLRGFLRTYERLRFENRIRITV